MTSTPGIPGQVPGVISADVDGERVLLNPVDLSYVGLNATAAAVWELVDGQRSVDAISELAAAQFDGDTDVITAECREVVAAFVSAGLATVSV